MLPSAEFLSRMSVTRCPVITEKHLLLTRYVASGGSDRAAAGSMPGDMLAWADKLMHVRDSINIEVYITVLCSLGRDEIDGCVRCFRKLMITSGQASREEAKKLELEPPRDTEGVFVFLSALQLYLLGNPK